MKKEISGIETITPGAADRMLEKNENRRISEARVLEYGSAMERGEWKVSNDAIMIAEDGTLINGQHRLRAVSVSGIEIEALVVRNAKKESRIVMDIGRKRTYADHRQISTGDRPSTEFAPVMRALLTCKRIFRDGLRLTVAEVASQNERKSPTFQMMDEELVAFPDLQDALTFGRKLSTNSAKVPRILSLTTTACVTGVLVTRRAAYGTDIDISDWEKGLHSGVGLYEGDPRLRLRTFRADRRSHFNVGNIRELAVYIKAFNAWAEGKKVALLAVKDEEKFPMPLGKDPFRP